MLTEKFREYCPQEVQDKVSPERWRNALIRASRPLAEAHNALKLLTQEEEEEAFTDFYLTLLNDAGIATDRDTAHIIAADYTYNCENSILIDGIRELLGRLRADGMVLGLLSDTWPHQPAVLDHFGLSEYFSVRTFSYELGMFKPDPRMFEDALAKLELSGEEVLFADDLPKVLSAAAAYGIHGVHVRFDPHVPEDPAWPSVTVPGQLLTVIGQINGRSVPDAVQRD